MNRITRCFFTVVPAVFLFTACRNGSGSSSAASYEEQKLTLEQQERQDPLRFLSTDGTYRENFWGRFVLEGTVTNRATVATYKDVVLEVSFYTKTETLLGTKQYTLYEYYKPGITKPFQLKVEGFTGTQKIGWSIVQASNN